MGKCDTMNKARFNPGHKKVVDSILLEIPGVVPGKMFGYPAYYVNEKLFACLYENGIGLKVPESMANEFVGKKGIVHFQPLGRRKMKEWIQINRERSEDYLKDRETFESSVRYVRALSSRKGKQ